MIELFGLKEQGTGVKERDLQKQVLLKVLSCGLERSLSISAPQIPLGSKRLELWVDPGLQILVVWPYCHSHTISVWLWEWDGTGPSYTRHPFSRVGWCLNLLRLLQQNSTDQASNKQQKCILYSCRGLQAQDQGASMVRFWREPSSGLQTAGSSLCPHIVKGMRELSGASFIMALIPFRRALLSSPSHLPEVPTS